MIKRATKAQQARFEAIKGIGCIACLKEGHRDMICGPIECHHLLSGGRRRGHSETVPLGKWHHQGIPLPNIKAANMEMVYGPSLRLTSKLFHETYGSDDELLAETNKLISPQERP